MLATGAAVTMTLTVVSCGLALTACEPDDARVAVTALPAVQLVESLRIGSVNDPDQALTRIGAVLPLANGNVWVLQPDDAEFRIYSQEGTLVLRSGGRGQGPGEFSLPGRLGLWGADRDSVWVLDPLLRRLSIFTTDGAFARSLAAPHIAVSERLSVDGPQAIARDGGAVALASYAPGQQGDTLPIVRYDPVSQQVPVKIATLARSGTIQIRWHGALVATGVHPMSDAPLVAFSQDGRVVILERDVDAAPFVRIVAVAPAGDTLWSREYPYEPREIPASETDSAYDVAIEAFKVFTHLEGRLSDDDAEAAFRQSASVPAHRPPVRDLRVGVDGRVWLEWSNAPGLSVTWWVLDRHGVPEAQLTTHERILFKAADARSIWAVETDALDVPYLVRYDVRVP